MTVWAARGGVAGFGGCIFTGISYGTATTAGNGSVTLTWQHLTPRSTTSRRMLRM